MKEKYNMLSLSAMESALTAEFGRTVFVKLKGSVLFFEIVESGKELIVDQKDFESEKEAVYFLVEKTKENSNDLDFNKTEGITGGDSNNLTEEKLKVLVVKSKLLDKLHLDLLQSKNVGKQESISINYILGVIEEYL